MEQIVTLELAARAESRDSCRKSDVEHTSRYYLMVVNRLGRKVDN
jgi:hypothetical protein